MTTPTNWPNPEQPGVPMFPDRDGWHLTQLIGATSPSVSFWSASEREWKSGGNYYSPQYINSTRKYIGASLTPTQITEMLAGERERCAREAEKHRSKANPHTVGGWDVVKSSTANSIAHAIRNLGDAP